MFLMGKAANVYSDIPRGTPEWGGVLAGRHQTLSPTCPHTQGPEAEPRLLRGISFASCRVRAQAGVRSVAALQLVSAPGGGKRGE